MQNEQLLNELNNLTENQLTKMTKTELIERFQQAMTIANQRRQQKSNKKYDVLEILKRGTPVSILDIANEMSISTKNVSSLLCYLKRDGITFHTNEDGCKYLV